MSLRILLCAVVAVSAVNVANAQVRGEPKARGKTEAKPAPAKPADKKPNTGDKAEAPKSDEASAVETAAVAAKLVEWARKNGSPAAMAVAAQMLDTVAAKDEKKTKTTEGDGAPAKSDKTPEELDAKALRDEAKQLAGDNAKMTAALETIAAATPKARGRTRGAARHCDTVRANATDRYRMDFDGREWAEVAVIGDGDTDLDLRIFDEYGNEIAADTDNTDECYVRWVPRHTGEFVIKIKNYGDVYNEYCLLTN